MSSKELSRMLLEKEILTIVEEKGSVYESILIDEVCHSDCVKQFIRTKQFIHQMCRQGKIKISTSPTGYVIRLMESVH